MLAETVSRSGSNMGIPNSGNSVVGQHTASQFVGSCFGEHD
jgi:hypothetical protein